MDRAKHVAVFTFPAYAHLAPAVPVLAELVRRGHRVTCFVTERFYRLVAATGAEVVPYDAAFPWYDGPTDGTLATMLAFFAEALAPLSTAVSRLDSDRPDLIAHDIAVTESARLLARSWSVPVVQLCSSVASSEGYSMAVRQNEVATGPVEPIDPGHPDIAAFVAYRDELLAGHRLDGIDLTGFGNEYGPNIVFYPREFQPAADTFDDRFTFVGPCLSKPAPGEWTPPPGRRVALVSAGSSYRQGAAEFLRGCIEALAGTDWYAAVTLGHRVSRDDLGPLPANVETHAWLPHPWVLPHASAFVTHTGLGSVMEALWAGVPMIFSPGNVDQRVIAAHATEMDLGRPLPPGPVDADELLAALDTVATDPAIQAATARMSHYVRTAGGADRAAAAMESLMTP